MPPHDVVLADWQAQDLADVLDSLIHDWLTEAPARTLCELAHYTDPCWSDTPGSPMDYTRRFIARLQRCRTYLEPPTDKEERPSTTQRHRTPGKGGQLSTVGKGSTFGRR